MLFSKPNKVLRHAWQCCMNVLRLATESVWGTKLSRQELHIYP